MIRMPAFALLVVACAHDSATALAGPPNEATRGETCEVKPRIDCGSGTLPRLDERSWSAAEWRAFLVRAAEGTTAVAMVDGKTSLVPGCKLPGKYLEIAGKPGRGRFWSASAGAVFIPQELPAACLLATHVVAVYATRESRFAAIVVPLPCPLVSDAAPAKGCLGRGATGAQRMARARAIADKNPLRGDQPHDSALLLELYALAPDDIGYQYLLHVAADCPFRNHCDLARDRLDAHRRRAPSEPLERLSLPMPQVDELRSSRSCKAGPPFLDCFPGLFEAAPGGPPGCWTIAQPGNHP